MQTKKYLLLCSLAVAICALFTAAEVRATDSLTSLTPPIPGDTPALSCTIGPPSPSPYFVATITLQSVEPIPACTGAPTGRCSKYTYGAVWGTGSSRSLLFSVSADIGIREICINSTCRPGLLPSNNFFITQKGKEEPVFDVGEDDFGQRWVRFTTNNISTQPLTTVSITTDESQPVAGTAGGKAGTKKGFCSASAGIQTPGKSVTEQNQGQNNLVRSQAGPCTVERTQDARGRTISMTLISPVPDNLGPGGTAQCLIELKDITVAGEENIDTFISPEAQITFGNNTRYCYARAGGGVICVGTP